MAGFLEFKWIYVLQMDLSNLSKFNLSNMDIDLIKFLWIYIIGLD